MSTTQTKEEWSLVVKPKVGWWNLDIKEIWRYRDLILLFVRRDFVQLYKQTILGPVWFFVQPLISSTMFTLIFSMVAKVSTDGLPPFLFYLSGLVGWNYFADTIVKTSDTFIANARIFGKVYFPRLVIPISLVISSMLKFGVQFILFLGILAYYTFVDPRAEPNMAILWTPYLLLLMAGLGLGLGIIISSATTKYRDLKFLIAFGIQLLMYATGVVIPLTVFEQVPWVYNLVKLNPMIYIIETFRFAYCGGQGSVDLMGLGYTTAFTIVVLFIGILIFNRVEKNFMDTV